MTTTPLFHRRVILLVAVLVALVPQLPYGAVHWSGLRDQGLQGADSYMRLLRVVALEERGDWYDAKATRTNAPYGETLHWGRPLDAVLAAGAWLAAPFTDDRGAVYIAGLLVGPVIGLVLVAVWSWGTRPFLEDGTFVTIVALTGAMVVLSLNLSIGRPDHHGFLALLLAVQLAACLRLAAGAGGRGTALLLGAAGGLAIWASVVAVLAQVVVALVLAAQYLRARDPAPRDIPLYAFALAAMLTVALLLERPPSDFLTVATKRVSVVHWTLAASAAACWWAIHRALARRPGASGRRERVIALALGGGIPLAITAVLFPRFFLGPFADFTPDVISPFLDATAEYQPLLPVDRRDLVRFLIFLGPAAIGLGYVLYALRRGPPEQRPVCEVLLIGLAVYIPAALWTGLLAIYAEVVGLVPFAMALAAVMRWERRIGVMGRLVPVRAFAALALITGPFVLAAAVTVMAGPPPPRQGECDWPGIAKFLRGFHGPAARRDILFTYLYRGPEMAWRTPYDVVGAPYGNDQSFRDTYALFTAETDAGAKRVVDARGIGLVLICRFEGENRLYLSDRPSFLGRLEAAHPPDWLAPVTLPGRLADVFELFRVRAP